MKSQRNARAKRLNAHALERTEEARIASKQDRNGLVRRGIIEPNPTGRLSDLAKYYRTRH